MNIDDSVLQNGEKVVFALRKLYSSHGYTPFRMSKFEEYDFYARNKDFLVSDNVITFTDTNGKLMALKPDVTLSIIKNSKDTPEKTQKVFYNENVYRVSKDADSFKEIMQTGLECFGKVSAEEVAEVILLACESLEEISADSVLNVSNLGIIENFISALGVSAENEAEIHKSIGEKNHHGICEVCEKCGVESENAAKLCELVSLHGKITEVKEKLASLAGNCDELNEFFDVAGILSESKFAERISIDFSVTDDINYYNGIVFKGFVKGVPSAVLSGGQYDRLMKKLQRKSSAVGFAVYLDVLERINARTEDADSGDDFVNVALPKGRLGERIYDMFAKAGYECPSILEKNRKLIFENAEKKVRYFWVKPSDVAIYVERGAADIGVAGKDIILEYEPDVYELLDMNTGICRMAVAAPKGFVYDASKTLRVATKFSNIAKMFYRSQGRDIDIIHLNGSIEIAPILGLSDVIVDIVETGATLRENNLEVIETILPISARLISNKSSFGFKSKQIEKIVTELSKVTGE